MAKDKTDYGGRENQIERFNSNTIALKNIVSNLPGHVYWKDSNGVYLGCNDKQAQSLGLASSIDLIGKTDYELPWGEQVADKFRENDLRIMQTGVAEIIEEPAKVNGKPGVVISHKLPLKDQNENIIGIIGISLDITQHKKDQEALQKIKHQLKGARLISASIAHEIRTPLATTKASIHLIKKIVDTIFKLSNNEDEIEVSNVNGKYISQLKEYIKLIDKKTDQCNGIINMLLTKLQDPQWQLTEFSKFSAISCIEKSLDEFKVLDNMVNKVKFIKDNDFEIMGNQIMIKHIIMNLYKNAIFYIQKARKGEIIIWLENKKNTNEIHFKDTSFGIPEKVLPNIFKPFFTTEPSTGTGVGLAFSKTVMKSHKGKITCASKEGEYTEFTLSFPKSNTI